MEDKVISQMVISSGRHTNGKHFTYLKKQRSTINKLKLIDLQGQIYKFTRLRDLVSLFNN